MLLDVSMPVTPRTAPFPGDQPFDCGWTGRLADGFSVNLGWAKTSPHVGTHVDAPLHYDDAGGPVGSIPLWHFVGPCLVVDAVGAPALHEGLLEGLDLRAAPRVLFRTQARSDPERFRHEFPVLTPGALDLLARRGVVLVGIDAPSFDPADARDLAVHRALGRAGIANVENLALDHAVPGGYELLAAPVRWDGMDAAPLRALLRK